MFNASSEKVFPKIRQLIKKSFLNSWSPDRDIDWSIEVELPAGVPRETYIDAVSQLYYAEEATLQVCARMIRELPDLDAKMYVCVQASEEARHADVYRRYLDRIGGIAPVNGRLEALFQRALAWSGPAYALVVALNVIMEGEALSQQKRRVEALPCPLFKQVNRRIMTDESRHAGFGLLYLAEVMPTVPADEKAAVYEWIEGLWNTWMGANEGCYVREPEQVLQLSPAELAVRWSVHQERLGSLGFAAAA